MKCVSPEPVDAATVNIEGGQVVELSSEGLDQSVIPDPAPPEEKQYSSRSTDLI